MSSSAARSIDRTESPAAVQGNATTTNIDSIWKQMFQWYSRKLETHPLMTKSITSGTIAGIGDLICQSALLYDSEEDKESSRTDEDAVSRSTKSGLDYARSARFVLLGMAFCAPTSHVWYNWIDRTFPGTKVKQVLTRVAVDQFTWTPVFFIIWLSAMWTLEGAKPETIVPRLKETYYEIMVSNWALWIPAQSFIFRLVPVKFQVLANNFVDLFWNAFLSFCAAGKTDTSHREK